MKYLIVTLLIAVSICATDTTCFSEALRYFVILKTEAQEEQQMEAIEEALITAMPSRKKDIKEALEEFEEIVDKTMEKGKKVVLYPKYTFEIAKKALEKQMARKDVGELLEEYQEAIIEGESATKIRRLIITGLDKDLSADEIIKQFEEKEEEDEEEDEEEEGQQEKRDEK